MKKTIIFQTNHLHQDDGEIIPAQVRCAPEQPLEIRTGKHPGADIVLPDDVHIALGRVDTHVHFRESAQPTPEEFEADSIHDAGRSYEETIEKIRISNRFYDVRRGSLAALKGGVWLIGAMGNTIWAPVGEERWRKTDRWYRDHALIFTHVWPRIEPGVAPIEGQEEKDFGSTFGGSGLSGDQRRRMYLDRKGGMISYHNDRERLEETLEEFKRRVNPPAYLLHPLYYDGGTVYAMQRETLQLALEAKLKRLLTRHIPTGPALDMILRARSGADMELPAEAGIDYLYFNRDMLDERETRMINYRRPALPSAEDQASLRELTRDCARWRDPMTFFASDHAPHPIEDKRFKGNGLPGNPGTRVLEHTHQIHMHLVHHVGFTHADIDWLAAAAPAKYIAQYRSFPYPVGVMQNGAMTNLCIFHPEEDYRVDESALQSQLHDPEYHTAYRDESLQGRVLYTVVNGIVYHVEKHIEAINLA